MSQTLFRDRDVYVTAVTAPASEGDDRRRVEFEVLNGPQRLDKEAVCRLVDRLLHWTHTTRFVGLLIAHEDGEMIDWLFEHFEFSR